MEQDTSARAAAIPWALWAVIAMFAITAACLLAPTLAVLRLGFALFAMSPALGALGVAVALVTAALVVGFARIGYGLYEGSRVARGLAFVLAGYLLLASLATDLRSAVTVLVALGCVGTAAMLALIPDVRAWFAGPWARSTVLPTSIVVGQVVVLICSAVTALLVATMLVAGMAVAGTVGLGGTGAGMIVGALLCAGIAGVGFWAKNAIGRGERSARIVMSAVTVADLVVVVILSSADESTVPLLASFVLHAAVVAAIWLPSDARRHFGEAPLPAVENLHRQVLDIGRSAPAPHPGPVPRPPSPPTQYGAPFAAPTPSWGPPAPPGPQPAGPPSPPVGVPRPGGRHARPDAVAGSPALAVDFCGQCGSRALPGAVHCVRCGSRLLGHGTAEPRP